jgi:citrate synthase
MSAELKRGLEGVLVAESDLSYVDGEAGRLVYRGYDIEDLARGASYEEVLYLLWRGSLPTRAELDAFTADLAAERAVDDDVLEAVRMLADAGERPMAALRTSTRRSGRAAGSRRRSRRSSPPSNARARARPRSRPTRTSRTPRTSSTCSPGPSPTT